MAWNDANPTAPRAPQRQALDMAPIRGVLDASVERNAQQSSELGGRLSALAVQRTGAGGSDEFEPAEFAMNAQTGEIALPNGQVIKATAPVLLQLATLTSDEGAPLPKMASVPKGFRPISQAKMREIIDSIPTESDFWGEAWAAGKSTLGLAAAAVDSLSGNDDPSNKWSGAQRELEESQSIGQLKASRGRWYSSFDSFLSGLGETVGNIAGVAVGAAPIAAAGAVAGGAGGGGVGAALGALAGAALGVSGGAAAFGEQATEFYDSALDAMAKMSPDQLAAESPLYREVLRENPQIDHEEAMREVAIRGARMAGTTAGLLGAVEGVVGGRLAGNFLARMGVTRSLLGRPLAAVEKRTGLPATAGRVGGRALLGGVGAGAEEVAESMFGQAAGAATTGIGSTNPGDYFDIEEGIAAAQGGVLLGALGGRGRRSPALTAEDVANTPLGVALRQTPDANTPWSRAQEPSEETDLLPTAMRRPVTVGQPPVIGREGPAPVPPGQLEAVRDQLSNVLAERFGPDWANNIDQIARLPQGRQLVGQLMDVEQQLQAEAQLQGEDIPAAQRGYASNVPPGEPRLRGPAFGDQPLVLDGNPPEQAAMEEPAGPPPIDPAQQELPGMGPEPGLAERRSAQMARQEEMRRLSEQNPQALPQRESRSIEQAIYDLDDQIEQVQEQLAARPPRDPRKKFLRQELQRLQAEMDRLEAQWVAQRELEGPQGVAPGAQVDAPEPVNAPQERMPDGRPVGVSPAPLVNPEPMSPEEAQARAASQTRRGQPTTPEEVQAAAQGQLQEGVAPTTPEPAKDIAAQVAALADPNSERDAVFIADGQRAAAVLPQGLPEGAVEVYRKGIGTLITTSKQKAQAFRRVKKDADIAKILGYSEPKETALANEPVAVQAVTPSGAVQAEQVASRKGVPAAKKAVKKQAQPSAKVVTKSPQAVQARRAAVDEQERRAAVSPEKTPAPPKAAAAVAKSKERSTPKKPVRKAKKDDDDRTRATEAPRAPAETAAPAASTADTVIRAAKRGPGEITFRGDKVELPATLVKEQGRKGTVVDLRTPAPDSEAASRIGTILRSGTLNAEDRRAAEGWLAGYRQIKVMLDSALAAAEERLKGVMERAGQDFTREAEQRQIALEQAMTGKREAKARTSPLAYLPLTKEETLGFMKALRREAKAELQAGYQPSQSVARQMINGISGRWEQALQSERDGRSVLKVFSELTDQQLQETLDSTHLRVMDSTIAKQVMRGATEVAHALRRMESLGSPTSQSYVLPDSASHEDMTKKSHSTAHAGVPEAAHAVLNEWVKQFEKGGNKFSAPIQLMSMVDAMRLRPDAFVGGRVPNGKFLRITDEKGNIERYVLAVDWGRFNEMAAMEVLAHEFGHVVTTELYARSSPATRMAIDRAYEQWLKRQEGRSVDAILRDQMPAIERAGFAGGATNRAYATKFWEWAARNAALYVLDENRPHLSAIEKFFKAIGDVMRRIYMAVRNPPTNRVWEEVLDNWINGTAEVYPMPQVPEATFNHEAFADSMPEGQPGLTKSMSQRATEALAPVRKIFAGGATPQAATAAAQKLTETIAGDLLRRFGLSLYTLRQMERKYRDTPLGRPLSAWVRNQQLKAKTANVMMEGGSRALERAMQLDARVRQTLEGVMYRATHFGIHPDKAFDAKENAHLTTDSERVTAVNQTRYATVRAMYEAMVKADPRAAEIYADLRDQFANIHKATLAKQLELVQASPFSEKVKGQIVARIKQAQREMRLGPYFPLMRFGNWIVKVHLPADLMGKGGKINGEWFESKMAAREEARHQRSLNPGAQVTVEAIAGEDGKYGVRVYQKGVYFFESEAEAKAARADIEKEVRENYAAAGVEFDDAQAQFEPVDDDDGAGTVRGVISQPYGAVDDYTTSKGGSGEFMQEVRALLAEHKLDPEVAATLERLAVESLPENNYRQSLLPRQNVFGASQHMLKSYAHRFQGAAHHYAAVEYGAALNKAWAEIRKMRETYPPAAAVFNTLLANQNEVRKRMSGTFGNRLMNIITDASSLFSLGLSPAYVITNSLQPWVVSAPVLGAMTKRNGQAVGMTTAMRYLKDAYAGAVPFFSKRGIAEFIDEAKAMAGQRGTSAGLQETAKEIVTKFGRTPEEQRMLESLLERGTLDFSWLNSIEDAMRGGKVAQRWANLQRLAMALPQQVETMNRVVTALAAYRLAKDERLTDGSEAALQEFADDTVADTQLDYSRMNRPLAFNKAGFNVILQFKLYMQGMYMLFARNAALALRGATPEERKQGARTLAYMTLTHAAAAGATAMGPAAWMAKLALLTFAAVNDDDDDDWKSADQLLNEMMKELFGEYAGEIAARGLPALLGVDMSDRLGFPVLYDSRFAGTKEADSTGTTIDKILIYSMGAPYSNFKRATVGTLDAMQGDFGKAINGLPSSVRAVARSAKWMAEGVVDRNGDQFIPREELGWDDLTINALGLSPTRTSRAYRERTEVKETTARIIQRRKELLQGARTGEDVADEIAEFNRKAPKPFRITADHIAASRKSKAARERGESSKQEAAVRKMLGQ